jgi:predicted negative regulator of RcsB-dependent stress response
MGQAIDTLDRLRFTWRGDRTELRTLLALARIHGENGNHRAGLLVLREAAVQFPAAREGREIATEMDLLFARLFLEGEADKLPPVQAIALFEEFRDLVPTGTRGDAMARRLADRLVEVDLMERAAALLEHQVKHRSTGVQRAELGARLATVRLLDAKPEAALQALAASDDATAPDALKAERHRLEARALADVGRNAEALARLGDDRSPDADRLRVDIMRQARDWRGVAQTLRRSVGEPPAGGREDRRRQGAGRAARGDGAGSGRRRHGVAAAAPAVRRRDGSLALRRDVQSGGRRGGRARWRRGGDRAAGGGGGAVTNPSCRPIARSSAPRPTRVADRAERQPVSLWPGRSSEPASRRPDASRRRGRRRSA